MLMSEPDGPRYRSLAKTEQRASKAHETVEREVRDVSLVTVDSLRADHVGCDGYDRDTTPAVDDLATTDHRFENAVVVETDEATNHPTKLRVRRMTADRLVAVAVRALSASRRCA